MKRCLQILVSILLLLPSFISGQDEDPLIRAQVEHLLQDDGMAYVSELTMELT